MSDASKIKGCWGWGTIAKKGPLPDDFTGTCKREDESCVNLVKGREKGPAVCKDAPQPQPPAPAQKPSKNDPSSSQALVNAVNKAIETISDETGIKINNGSVTLQDLKSLSIAGAATLQQKAKAIQEVLENLSDALKQKSITYDLEGEKGVKSTLKNKNLPLAQLVKLSGIKNHHELIWETLKVVDLEPAGYLACSIKEENKDENEISPSKDGGNTEEISSTGKKGNGLDISGGTVASSDATPDQLNVQKVEDINTAKPEEIWDQTIESALGFDPTKVRVAEEDGKLVVYINDKKIENVDVSNGLNQDEISLIERALGEAGSTEVNEKLIEKIRQGMKLYGVDSDNGISFEDAKKYIETLLKYQKSRRISTLEKTAQAYRKAGDFDYEDLDAEVKEAEETEKETRSVLGVNEQTTVEMFINSAENKYNGTAAILEAYIKTKNINVNSKDSKAIQALIDLLIRLPEASRFSKRIQGEVFEVYASSLRKFPARAKYTKDNILAYLENRIDGIKVEEVVEGEEEEDEDSSKKGDLAKLQSELGTASTNGDYPKVLKTYSRLLAHLRNEKPKLESNMTWQTAYHAKLVDLLKEKEKEEKSQWFNVENRDALSPLIAELESALKTKELLQDLSTFDLAERRVGIVLLIAELMKKAQKENPGILALIDEYLPKAFSNSAPWKNNEDAKIALVIKVAEAKKEYGATAIEVQTFIDQSIVEDTWRPEAWKEKQGKKAQFALAVAQAKAKLFISKGENDKFKITDGLSIDQELEIIAANWEESLPKEDKDRTKKVAELINGLTISLSKESTISEPEIAANVYIVHELLTKKAEAIKAKEVKALEQDKRKNEEKAFEAKMKTVTGLYNKVFGASTTETKGDEKKNLTARGSKKDEKSVKEFEPKEATINRTKITFSLDIKGEKLKANNTVNDAVIAKKVNGAWQWQVAGIAALGLANAKGALKIEVNKLFPALKLS